MNALLVIDAQNGLIDHGEFTEELQKINEMIADFKGRNQLVLFVRHLDDTPDSRLYKESEGSRLHHSVASKAEIVIDKKTPSAFFQTELGDILQRHGVDHLYITGFQTEFCCLFTAISAFDRGYRVTFIEDATGTLGTEEEYEMPGLDIRDFIGTVLHWSDVIEVLDFDEYKSKV